MNKMVVGLYYDTMTETAVFIRKNRPLFMKGRLNLPGGKVEAGETPAQAISREFMEETGIITSVEQWSHTITLKNSKQQWQVDVFMTEGSNVAKTMTDEQVERYDAWNFPFDALPNLRWIIPLCLDRMVQHPVLIEDICD